jgi:RNA polymerase sigma-B factor
LAAVDDSTSPEHVERDRLDAMHHAYASDPTPELCQELVSAYEGLATQLARRLAHRGEPFEDLRQTALLALVAAIEGFDPDRGVRFASYAIPTIAGQLKRHLRDRGWLVRPPRRLQELYLRVYAVLEELEQDIGRRPPPDEIATRLGASVEEVLEALEAAGGRRGVALDAPIRPEGNVSFSATLGGDDIDLARADDALTVADLVRRLPERERYVIRLSFFEGLTQQQIASQLGKTHVSRTIARALARMRCYDPAATSRAS